MKEASRSNESAQHAELENQSRRATRITFLGQAVSQVLSFAILAALYHLVDPVEFGLLGMFMPIVLLVRSFSTLGMDIASIQRAELTSEQLTSLFWLQIATGAIITLVLICLSPLLAYWYQADRLLWVGVVLAGTSLLHNSYAQPRANAEKRLEFGRLTIVRFVSLGISGVVAISMAWWEFGVWALVAHQYTELVVLNLGLWLTETWRPNRLASWGEISAMLRFGSDYTVAGVLFAAGQNLDKLLLGWFLGGSAQGQQLIGYYTQAYNLMIRPVYLVTTPITAAMLPSLARLSSDRAAFERLAISYYRMLGVILAPVSVGIFVVGADFMLLLGGSTWREGGLLLQCLAPMILAQAWINICGSLLSAINQTKMLVAGAAANFLALVVTGVVAVGLSVDDRQVLPFYIASGVSVCTILFCLPYLAYCFSAATVQLWELCRQLMSAVMVAALMGIVVWWAGFFTDSWPVSVRLATQIVVGVAVYAVLAKSEIGWLIGQLRPTRAHGDQPSTKTG